MPMTIESQRLIIRPLESKDIENYHELFSNPANLEFETFSPLSLEESKETLAQWMHIGKENGGQVGAMEFGIAIKDTDEIVGVISGFYQDIDSCIMEFGIAILQKCWKMGYAYEASFSFFQYVFLNTLTQRVFSSCNARNVPCINLLKKIGMQKEGHFRKSVKMPDGSYHDEAIFAILKEDFIVKYSL
jgi:ribosomal-protein-alanine N-acetyltransferase